jgi:rhomboid protease GluP
MFKRQTTGSVVCPSCGSLVGIREDRCFRCGRRNPGLWGFAPSLRALGRDMGFVSFVIGGCTALYVITLIASGPNIRMQGIFSILSPSTPMLFLFGASGALPVFEFGRWWTVVSASWLHGSLLHILFNMLWVRQIAPGASEIYGPGRMVIIYTVAGVCGFALSSFAGAFGGLPIPFMHGAQFTIGASASIFGLLAALVCYSRRGGSSHIGREALVFAAALFVFGLVMPGVDNYAHAGGFAGGYLTALWLDPRRPERIEHLIAAVGCLALAVVSVLASVVTGLPLFR